MTDAIVYERLEQLPANLLESCRPMPLPDTILMCRPDHFNVVDVKNPHMEGNIGKVDKDSATNQWEALKEAFQLTGTSVELIDPLPGCEDMVFCANQTFPGFDANGEKLCILSQMKHTSRQREVSAFSTWFSDHGYRVEELPSKVGFEGSGDAIWHPGKGLVWGGSGFRTDSAAYQHVSKLFSVPVIHLPLSSDRFYHLDTCFCAIDEKTVLINPQSLSEDGIAMINAVFDNVIECDEKEANEGMACNATAISGKHVLIQKNCEKTVATLTGLGYKVIELETGEFLKSGGSVFCLKMYVF